MSNNLKGSTRGWITPLLSILLLAVLLFLRILPERLVISDERTERTLLTLPLACGEQFSLRYMHSVNLSDVTDTIEWTGETLVCRSTLFTAFGAGIPVLADGVGTDFTQTDEGFLITGIDKPEERILMMLQEVPDQRLLWRGTEIPLARRYGSGTLIRLAVRPCSPFETLFLSRPDAGQTPSFHGKK